MKMDFETYKSCIVPEALGVLIFVVLGTIFFKDWNSKLKTTVAKLVLKFRKKEFESKFYNSMQNEEDKMNENELEFDKMLFWGNCEKGSSLYVEIKKVQPLLAELTIHLKTPDGNVYTLPDKENSLLYGSEDKKWKAGDLTLTCLNTNMLWRIHFNGLLVKNNNEICHVRLNFIWRTCSAPIVYPNEISPNILAGTKANEPWKSVYRFDNTKKMLSESFRQFGSMIGTVNFSETQNEFELNLPGLKLRQWSYSGSEIMDRTLTILGRTAFGHIFEITRTNLNDSCLQNGHLRLPNDVIISIDQTNLNELHLEELQQKEFILKFKANNKKFNVIINQQTNFNACEILPINFTLDSDQGNGLLVHKTESYKIEKPTNIQQKRLFWKNIRDVDHTKICATFVEEAACCPDFVGAKGASLALLYSKRSQDYNVPNGFCLTRNAMDVQIESNQMFKEAITEIVEAVSKDVKENYLKNACEKTVKLFEETKIPSEVEAEVRKCFNNLHEENKTFAVRSSGIGEDSEELSAAGQNATILGCKNIDEVLKGIQKCWASLFTYQSVEYRRQHGQVVNCGMGVVVQTIVDANSAGVMFSRHPNTGNPKEILITSNYGLGETVVSGHVEPDTIILSNCHGELKIKEKSVGKKSHKIIVSNDGMQTVELDQGLEKSCSLTDDQCLKLGKLALLQESLWGAPRDIEWAIVNDDVYLLQARPITNLNQWTDIELLHEYDTAVMSEHDLITFGNTGEVLPGALTPLTISTALQYMDENLSTHSGAKWTKYNNMTLLSTHNRVGISVFNTVLRHVEKKISVTNKIASIAIFGRPIFDETMYTTAIKRNGCTNFIANNLFLSRYLFGMLRSKRKSNEAFDIVNSLDIKLDNCYNSLEMYQEIQKFWGHFSKISNCHMYTTSGSVFSQIMFLSTLLQGGNEFTTENYNDIATVLSSCKDVVSANIPEGLKKIANAIRKSQKAQNFIEIDSSIAVAWLEDQCPEVYDLIQEFLQMHGHRCIQEFELAIKPWGMNPTPLIKSLQASVKQSLVIENVADTSSTSVEDILNKLKSPINFISRGILKFIIPICRNSVACRETTKSALVLGVHKLRLAYFALGQQMFKEWRLPSTDHIFFLTNIELLSCIQNRDPNLVSRANLRKRYFSKMQTLRFSELNYGIPKPINVENENCDDGKSEQKVIGTPVFPGRIIGRACVIKFFDEISQLQEGDILITTCTDIGWSPYFPLLGGVITELGGLISHGAVVAREYGLPCLVGAERATSMFKTGDTVILDATKGYIIKEK